jgi:hypothetical protein
MLKHVAFSPEEGSTIVADKPKPSKWDTFTKWRDETLSGAKLGGGTQTGPPSKPKTVPVEPIGPEYAGPSVDPEGARSDRARCSG